MRPTSLRIFFRLAFGITWGAGAIALILGALRGGEWLTPGQPLYVLAGFGPSLAGLLVTARDGGRPALLALLARCRPAQSLMVPTAGVTLLFVAVLALGFMLAGQSISTLSTFASLPFAATLPAAVLRDTGPLGEEFGWRGVALPALLTRNSPLVAALRVGIAWTLWHLPTFFLPQLAQHALSFPLFALHTIALSAICTWFYMRSEGNLLLMMWIHLLANLCAGMFGLPLWTLTCGTVAAAAALWIAAPPQPVRSSS